MPGQEPETLQKQVYDLAGKLSLQTALQQGVNSIDISSLPPGAYIVKANTNTRDMFTQKIIKQ
ncbi:MAG: T9SS type A sorting domain-containing protein [Bacteroidota bacterium]